MKLTVKIALLLIAALTILSSCKTGKVIDDGSSAKVAEFETIEQANDFIKANRIKNVKTLDAINGDRVYLIIPSKPEIRLDLANAVLDDNYNIGEGEMLTMGETGSPIMFSYTAPEVMPLIVVVAVDEVGRRTYWSPQYSGEDGSLITTDEFKLFSDNKKKTTKDSDQTPIAKEPQYVTDATWVEIPDITLPQIDTTLLNFSYAKVINAEIREAYEGFFTEEWNNYQANKDLGGHGPKAFYEAFVCDDILSIVLKSDGSGFEVETYSYAIYTLDIKTGVRAFNEDLIKKANLSAKDILNAVKAINGSLVGFSNEKTIAYSNFIPGYINPQGFIHNPMYLNDNGLIMVVEVEGLPYGMGTYIHEIPVNELLSKVNIEQIPPTPAGCYAVSNKLGSEFIVKVSQEMNIPYDPNFSEDFKYAIYDSKVYNIEYSHFAQGNPEKDNHRDTPYNYENLRGEVFTNKDGDLNPKFGEIWSPIFLCNEEFMNKNTLVHFEGSGSEVEPEVLETFENHYNGRKITRSALTFTFGNNGGNSFYSLQFEHQGNQALGVYAIKTENGTFYLEVPREIDPEYTESIWRVDDMGEFYLENTPSAIFRTADGYRFMMIDSGFEGYNCYDITIKGDIVERGPSYYSGYQAPM